MFIVKKLLTPFLMPPGIFVSMAFAASAFLFRKNRRYAALWAVFAAFLWAASLRPLGSMALEGLEYAYLPPSAVKADAVVVLSAGIREGAPSPLGGAALTGISAERAAEAARIYLKYRLPVVVTGGAVFSRGTEAGAMKDYLVGLGVPESAVFTEERSRDTMENALFSKRLCDEKGYKRVVLVTSAYHMRRSVWTFKKAGFSDLIPWPAGYMCVPAGRRNWSDYLPGSYDMLRISIHERLGLLFYRVSMRPERAS